MFSVVIPLYNKESSISETLHSVFNQTFSEFEVIVVNDGSTDNSLEVVNSFSDPRLRVFTRANAGVSAARNYGVEKSNFENIALLDADDRWEPNYLEEMERLISKYPTCSLYASAFKRITRRKVLLVGTEVKEGIAEDFFKLKLLYNIPCSSVTIIKKKALLDIGGFPVGMIGGEDDYTFSKIAVDNKVAYTPRILATYDNLYSTNALRRGKIDSSKVSWLDLYEEGNYYRNEFIAKKAINRGIRHAYHSPQKISLEIERRTRYTELSKKRWKYLYYLNRLPYVGIVLLRSVFPYYKKTKFWLADRKRALLNR